MKTVLLSDQINQCHWSMLKSVVLILSLLPLSHFFMNLWQSTEGSSQIMIGFMVISVFSACSIISFYAALNATVMPIEQTEASAFERAVVKVYRYIPMLSLTGMMSFLATQF
ncbi:hypothetical protein [Acinetobacter lanii]|uniref:Uncharacterized protein n=1 Tax=Acinetobacter lanii TaxID=2715163 RepID=A0A6G8S0V2_9GAMM|nr:hypothetical protein [Acinetobacter lanii]QIO07842.1 hypothetical protein G8D99_01540 [Acinetobacter lanii]